LTCLRHAAKLEVHDGASEERTVIARRKMAAAVLAGLCLPATAGLAGSAAAAVPTKTTYPVSFPVSTVVSCGSYDVVLDELAGQFTDTVFTNKEGDFVRIIRHASLSGVLRNSETGYELTYRVKRTSITDAATLTTTVTGLSRQVRLPGGEVVALAAGREVVDFSQGFPPTTIGSAGRSIADFEAQLCDLLRAS
jgi:hypothetical protein